MSRRIVLALALVALAAAAAPARADTVTGTFRFLDNDGALAPIANARVEVWRFRPMYVTWGAWSWNNDLTLTTDGAGRINATLAFITPGVVYGLRVFATNGAAQVFVQDNVVTPFWREPGLPGPERQFTVQSSTAPPMNFSFDFTDDWARRHFNVADAIAVARQYVDAHRDPRETDGIGRVDVMMQGCCNTYYDPVAHLIRLGPQFHLDDLSIIHEYGHFIEEQISSFYGIASVHDGCDSGILSEPGIAWMEGFASYLSRAVADAFPTEVSGPGLGTSSTALLESPLAFCGVGSAPASREGQVAAVLHDLRDFANEAGDLACGRDDVILQIADRELDLGWTNPNINQFAEAWLARGLDARPLVAAMNLVAIPPPSVPTTHRYSPLAGADVAVWRPAVSATWFIRNGAIGTTIWGTTGDQPVPADFDGDGVTDLAVFRASEGNWFVRKSMGDRSEVTRWGTSGDLALAGDRDGDGEAELVVYRPSSATFFFHGDTCSESAVVTSFTGLPAVGDFDGNGRADVAVYDPPTGLMEVVLDSGLSQWGFFPAGGVMMSRDFDGDGRVDRGVYTQVNGTFHFDPSTGGARRSIPWGVGNELPAPADFEPTSPGVELATWSPTTGNWFIRRGNGTMMPVVQWGANGDIPVPR